MNVEAFLNSLKYMGVGMVGIFVIITIIVVLINVLIKAFPTAKEDRE